MRPILRVPVMVLLALTVLAGLAAPAEAQLSPVSSPVSAPTAPVPEPGDSAPASECGLFNLPACVSEAIGSFFTALVTPGLSEVLGLLSDSLLVTPKLDEVPVLSGIWEQSRHIVLLSYTLVVSVAGLVVLTYHTLQTRASIKEIFPRIVVGFIAANFSLLFAGYAIDVANAFSRAILGSNLDPNQVGQAMADTLLHDLDGGSLLLVFVALALLGMLLVVLLTYVVRLMLTILLLAAAPLLLMCHALPHTESIAFWWWKAFAGTLVIQIGQSFALVAALKLFFMPGGITLF